ncbi:hypothetical protein BOX15_Mlig023238g1 [Macrostomum lignano]|uniref:Uncharacterized protein n=2 Tax=Macrostomum lignano TaxID=282301 RepID=A0A267GUL1_9PLAT|nr:hypothetical protein BOX15_Mlig023238g1 [Macrostomum lignano]
MEWNALPPNVGFDFDVDAKSGYLNRFVVAPSTHTGEWAGLLRYFTRPVDQKPWDLKRTYLDVEAEFVCCCPKLLGDKPGGLVVHLLSKSGKRGSVILMSKILTEAAEKAKNYATIAVDKTKDILYCGYNSRSEQQAYVEVFTDVSSLAFNFRSRHPIPGMRQACQFCLQSNNLCVSGFGPGNSGCSVALMKWDTLAPVSSSQSPFSDPNSLWFDLECDLVAVQHSSDDQALQIETRKRGERIMYTFPKMRQTRLQLCNDRFGRLYVHARTLSDPASNLFGPLELFFSTFQVDTRRTALPADGDRRRSRRRSSEGGWRNEKQLQGL